MIKRIDSVTLTITVKNKKQYSLHCTYSLAKVGTIWSHTDNPCTFTIITVIIQSTWNQQNEMAIVPQVSSQSKNACIDHQDMSKLGTPQSCICSGP